MHIQKNLMFRNITFEWPFQFPLFSDSLISQCFFFFHHSPWHFSCRSFLHKEVKMEWEISGYMVEPDFIYTVWLLKKWRQCSTQASNSSLISWRNASACSNSKNAVPLQFLPLGPHMEVGPPPHLPPAHYMERFSHSLMHSTSLHCHM